MAASFLLKNINNKFCRQNSSSMMKVVGGAFATTTGTTMTNTNNMNIMNNTFNTRRHITTSADTHYVLTAVGSDRVGIVSDISKVVLDHNGNIGESRMMQMGGNFTVMMRISYPDSNSHFSSNSEDHNNSSSNIIDNIHSALSQIKPPLDIMSRKITDSSYEVVLEPIQFSAKFTMEGADHPGLLFAVTDMFRSKGLMIDRLKSDSEIAPYGGAELFTMKGTVIARRKINLEDVQETIDELKNVLDIELDLSHINHYSTDMNEEDLVQHINMDGENTMAYTSSDLSSSSSNTGKPTW